MALLHATAHAATAVGLETWALHVHHGLMPQADEWSRLIERRCAAWRRKGLQVCFAMERLPGAPAPGQSIEAWARVGRYSALTRMALARQINLVLLAHHRRDQAETVLLQALRSGGPAGLSAMPRAAHRDGVWWVRPWLDRPRQAVEAYVKHHRVRFVDDPSNADDRLARSRLRAQAWDALSEAFPQAEAALAGTARRMQEAAACNAELALIDLAVVQDDQGRLGLGPWGGLSAARRANVLRHWASGRCPKGIPETLVERLLQEACVVRDGAHWPAPGGQIHRVKGSLVFVSGSG